MTPTKSRYENMMDYFRGQGAGGASRKRLGMAGILVVTMVLGYLIAISYSNNYLVQVEMQGVSAKTSTKQAYWAAFAGINYVVSKLRNDKLKTFSTGASAPFYFSDTTDGTAGHPHYRSFLATTPTAIGNVNYNTICGDTCSQLQAVGEYACSDFFTLNANVYPKKFNFIICSYPWATPVGEPPEIYWVKSMGIYRDSDNLSDIKCQLWAQLEIDRSAETVNIKKYGQMPVQTATYTAGLAINDFWDWQDTF